MPDAITEVLALEGDIAAAAEQLLGASSLYFLGRVRAFPVAREGAQKFKEITYRHAEAYQTSELKHGPLALIDDSVPSVFVLPDDNLLARNLAAVQQVLARGGRALVVTHKTVSFDDPKVSLIQVPKVEHELDSIVMTVVLQLLAYHAARQLGLDVDKPRNLAKSVTVE